MSQLLGLRSSLALLFDRGNTAKNVLTVSRSSTATSYNKFKNIEELAVNTPRLDYDPSSGALKGLLIEGSRTNLATLAYDDTPPVAPPEGLHGGNAHTSTGLYAEQLSGLSGDYYVQAWVYIPTAYDYDRVEFRADSNTSKVVATDPSKRDQWQFIEGEITGVTTNIDLQSKGSGTNRTVHVAGVQVVQGKKTSYIPTDGASATRNSDSITVEGQAFTDFFNPEEGTFIVSFEPQTVSGTRYALMVHGTNAGDSLSVVIENSALDFRVETGAVSQVDQELTASLPVETQAQLAVTYTQGSWTVCLNGGTVLSGSIASFPPGLDTLVIGQRDTEANQLEGHFQRLVYYPVKLADQTIIDLTT